MICKGCFQDKGEQPTCIYCGYREGDYPNDDEGYVPGSVLGGRYMLGNIVRSNHSSILYKGYDRRLDQFVLVRQKRDIIDEKNFLQKARWLSYFSNNNHFITIYDYVVFGEECFMIHPYVIEGNLDTSVMNLLELDETSVEVEDFLIDEKGEMIILDFFVNESYPQCDLDNNCYNIENQWKEDNNTFLKENTALQNRYNIVYPLGKGGFGVVYLAYDSVLDRKVAIKEFLPSEWAFHNSEDGIVELKTSAVLEEFRKGLKSFQREAMCLARMNLNDNIVDIYDFFYENETAYIVMEYVKGENIGILRELLDGFSYEAAKDIFIKLLDVLQFVHEKGIVHQDISPGNILLNKESVIKVIDFGSAHVVGSRILSLSEMMIKPGYAALEQYDEEYESNECTDVYQAAATYYMMITGKKPPDASQRVENDSLKLPSEMGFSIPPEDEDILKHALEVLPEKRICSIKELKMKLVNVKDKTEESK